MGWTGTQLNATQQALAAAGKPLMFSGTALRGLTSASMRWNQTGSFADADSTDTTNGPVTYVNDDDQPGQSRPTSSQTTWYLLFQLASASTAIDCVAVLNHNLGTTGDVQVQLQVADDNTFATNLLTLKTWNVVLGTTSRLISVILDGTGGSTPTQYVGGLYVRLKITSTGGIKPLIGEVVLGQRRQLKHAPELDWNDEHLKSSVQQVTTLSGRRINNVQFKGQRRIDARLTPAETTYIDDLRAFWKTDCDIGTRPFVWVDDPTKVNSQPCGPFMQFDDPDLNGTWVGPAEKDFQLVATEQSQPFVVNEMLAIT
jgi:hypothetical protein